MANPFYPPKGSRPDRSDASRGSIGYTLEDNAVPFDPDRRGQWVNGSPGVRGRQQEPSIPRRQGTEGPGAAADFYAPATSTAPGITGAGADGFGHGFQGGMPALAYAQPGYSAQYHDPYEQPRTTRSFMTSPQTTTAFLYDHRDEYADDLGYDSQRKAGIGQLGAHGTTSTIALNPTHLQVDHHYPPSRPGTPGIYLDRAPRHEALTDEQKKILATFPKDLDDEKGGLISSAKKMLYDWRKWVQWKYTHYYIILLLICVLVALMTIYHRQIIDWLTPVSKKINSVSWGWVIPVAILFVISFPPLFGHEIVGVLCGVVYGLWIGFGILSLGTLLGEIGNFYAFKWFLQKHAEKYERKSLNYACMAHIVREGGFIVILLARLSAIPGHFTTAVFATVGMNFFVFTLAAILSLPKQLVVVYLGVAIEEAGSGDESTQSKIIKWVVLMISFAVTIAVAVYLYDKMQKARPHVQAKLRQRRYTMLTEAASGRRPIPNASPERGDAVSLYGQPGAGIYSETNLPKTADLEDSDGESNMAERPRPALHSMPGGRTDQIDRRIAMPGIATRQQSRPQYSADISRNESALLAASVSTPSTVHADPEETIRVVGRMKLDERTSPHLYNPSSNGQASTGRAAKQSPMSPIELSKSTHQHVARGFDEVPESSPSPRPPSYTTESDHHEPFEPSPTTQHQHLSTGSSMEWGGGRAL